MLHGIRCSLVLSIGFALRASFWGCAIGLCRWNLPRGVASGFGLRALPLGVAPGLRLRALSVGSDPGRSSLGSVSGRQGDDVHGSPPLVEVLPRAAPLRSHGVALAGSQKAWRRAAFLAHAHHNTLSHLLVGPCRRRGVLTKNGGADVHAIAFGS